MMPRSGSMQARPMIPVKVLRRCGNCSGVEVAGTACRIMEGLDATEKRFIVSYGHPRTQGTDSTAARAARGLSVLQRGRRDDLCRQGARAARSRAQLSRRV